MSSSSEKSQLQGNVLIVICDFIKTNKICLVCIFMNHLITMKKQCRRIHSRLLAIITFLEVRTKGYRRDGLSASYL